MGIGEAVVLPIVPDVLLGVMALARRQRSDFPWSPPSSARSSGRSSHRPLARSSGLVARLISLQPGLGPHGLTQAQGRIERDGAVRGFTQVEPGCPSRRTSWRSSTCAGDPVGAGSAASPWSTASRGWSRRRRLRPRGHPCPRRGLSPSAAVPIYVVGWTTFYLAFSVVSMRLAMMLRGRDGMF